MNYILKNWIVKKGLFWYCSSYSTWKNNHNLHFFLNCFASSFFFLSSFGQYMGLFANHFFGNQNTADAQEGAQESTFIDQL